MERGRGIRPEDISRFCGPGSFQRGLTYYRAGRIMQLRRDRELWSAFVVGAAFRVHKVTVRIFPDLRTSCDCAIHRQWQEPCKHIAAALCAISDEELSRATAAPTEDESLRELVFEFLLNSGAKAQVENVKGGVRLTVTDRKATTTVSLALSREEAKELLAKAGRRSKTVSPPPIPVSKNTAAPAA